MPKKLSIYEELQRISLGFCFKIDVFYRTRPNEFGSMTARKDDTSPIRSISYHERP